MVCNAMCSSARPIVWKSRALHSGKHRSQLPNAGAETSAATRGGSARACWQWLKFSGQFHVLLRVWVWCTSRLHCVAQTTHHQLTITVGTTLCTKWNHPAGLGHAHVVVAVRSHTVCTIEGRVRGGKKEGRDKGGGACGSAVSRH